MPPGFASRRDGRAAVLKRLAKECFKETIHIDFLEQVEVFLYLISFFIFFFFCSLLKKICGKWGTVQAIASAGILDLAWGNASFTDEDVEDLVKTEYLFFHHVGAYYFSYLQAIISHSS